MENKNNKPNFFKREGFYLVLFICLCIVATVAVITTKNNKHAKINESVKQEAVYKNKAKKDVAKEPSTEYQNALQVKDNNAKNSSNGKLATEASASTDMNFIKPVDGKVARAYSEQPVYWKSTDTYRANLGVDVKCELGAPVVASMDGIVEEINKNTQDGIQIILKHPNGLKTVYANLDPKVKVSQGNKVKKGDQLGIIGKTTLRSAYETYGDHLHFEVLKGNVHVDPSRYIKY